MAPPSRCPSCGETGTRTCTGCRNVQYCGEECERADQHNHRLLCKNFAEFRARPGVTRAIFFPPDDPQPQFVSIRDWDDLQALIGKDERVMQCSSNKNPLTHDKYKQVNLFYAHDFVSTYGKPNSAIHNVTAGKATYHWGGPIVAVCGDNTGLLGSFEFSDIDMKAYSDLIAWIIDFYNSSTGHELRKGRKVDCVKLYSVGARRLKKLPPAEIVRTPRTHPVFDSEGMISPISQRIGMPLLLWKYPLQLVDASYKSGDNCNERATFMLNGHDINASNFGWAPLEWRGGEVANVLVARVDHEPLAPGIVKAFGDYCRHHLKQYLDWSDEVADGDEDKRRELRKTMLEEMTPAKWADYLSDWRQVKAGVQNDPAVNGRMGGVTRMGLSEEDGDRLLSFLLYGTPEVDVPDFDLSDLRGYLDSLQTP